MRMYYRAVATLNFLGVLGYMAGMKLLLWPLVLTAIILFSNGITSHHQSKLSALFIVGAPFNFIGVISGGLTKTTAVLPMAMIGSILLLVAYWFGQTTKPSTTSETPGNNIPD